MPATPYHLGMKIRGKQETMFIFYHRSAKLPHLCCAFPVLVVIKCNEKMTFPSSLSPKKLSYCCLAGYRACERLQWSTARDRYRGKKTLHPPPRIPQESCSESLPHRKPCSYLALAILVGTRELLMKSSNGTWLSHRVAQAAAENCSVMERLERKQ